MEITKSPLRVVREKRQMTLGALAPLVDSDVGNLSRIERGVQLPSKELAEKICKQFPGELTEIHLFYPERFPDFGKEACTQTSSDTSAAH